MSQIYESFMKQADPSLMKNEQKQVVSSSAKGPIGLVDSYQLFAEQGDDAWHVVLPTPPAKKKKIIFADPLMGKRYKDSFEFELWEDLTAQHEVFLWDEENSSLREQQPIKTCDDFLAANEYVKGDSEKEIRQALALQGHDPDDYIILDTANYYRYLAKAYQLSPVKYELRNCIVGEIYSYLLGQKNNTLMLRRFHPSFFRHLEKCAHSFNHKNEYDEAYYDFFQAAGNGEIADLSVMQYDDAKPIRLRICAGNAGILKNIINIPHGTVELSLEHIRSLGKLDLSQLPNLSRLYIKDCQFDMSVMTINHENIKNLRLVNVEKVYPGTIMQNLEVLTLEQSRACGDAPNLCHLNLSKLPDDFELDLSRYESLESLIIKSSKLASLKLPAIVNHLIFDDVSIGRESKMDLSDVKQCISLQIGDRYNSPFTLYSEIILPQRILSINLARVTLHQKPRGLEQCGVRNLTLASTKDCIPEVIPKSLEYFNVEYNSGIVDEAEHLSLSHVKYFVYPIHLNPALFKYHDAATPKVKSTALVDIGVSRRPKLASGTVVAKDFSNNPVRVTGYGVDLAGRLNVVPDHYRVHIKNVIEYKHQQLIFTSDTTNLKPVDLSPQPYHDDCLKILKSNADNDTSIIAFHIEATLAENVWLPVPSECALTRIDKRALYCSDNINWFYSEDTQQYFVTLKANQTNNNIQIAYTHKRNKNYEITLASVADLELMCSSIPLLPHELIIKLVATIKATSHLHFMLDLDTSLNEKLALIIDYCTNFKQVDAIDLSERDDIQILINNLVHQTGVCIDRTFAFVALTRYLGIHTSYLDNEDHAYIEIPHLVEGELAYSMVDLGGGEVLDLTSNNAREDKFEKISPWQEKVIAKPEPPKKKIFTRIHDFHSLLKYLENSKKQGETLPPLIPLDNENPIAVAGCLIQESKEPSLYIHSPDDFKRYLEAVVLQNGKRTIQQGLLHNMLKNGGLLVINWSTFTSTEIASYKSILEANGTLKGHSVSPKLNIISLIERSKQKQCESFMTRITRYRFTYDYLQKLNKPTKANNGKPIVVDLFNMPNWRERLLAKVTRHGKQYELLERDILLAIRSKRPLVIQNAPNEEALHALLQRIKHEGRLLFNGEMIEANHFTYSLSKKEYDLTAENVMIYKIALHDGERGVYLNANNLSQCYERMIIDNITHSADTVAGYLATHQHFYITDYINQGAWAELISHTKKYPDKIFTFTLLPGAEIEGVATGAEPSQQGKQCNVVFSNDPDYYCLCQRDKTLVIDITPETNYQSLIADLIESRDVSGDIDFTLETGPMLQSLMEGRHVILNGSVNYLLYQQLLPLLEPHRAQFDINSEPVKLKGKLTLVMPMKARHSLSPSQWHSEDYTTEQYRQHFKHEQQADIDKIKRLFHYARALKHNDTTTIPPVLNFANLKNMLAVLARPKHSVTHTSNPLKGWLNYDYPKNGEHYAFLNVIAKCMFAPKIDENKNRVRKLKQLIKTLGIDSREKLNECVWEILNCCSVGTIRNLLGDIELNPIDIINGKPVLPAHIVDELFNYLQTQTPLSSLTKEDNKSEAKFKQVLQAESTPVLFLKGPPGTRKTHVTRLLKESLPVNHYFKGDDQILAWILATSNNDEPLILHLDEANLALPGMWDIFKALFRDGRTIYYKGREYTISKQHKVIFTGNDETMPGRHSHQFFKHYAEKIYFTIPSDKWINAEFLEPSLKKLALSARDAAFISKHLLWAFHHIKDFNPYIQLSLRNVISLMQRFESLYDDNRDIKTLVYETCCLEFASEISQTDLRIDFMETIQDKLAIKSKDKDEDERIIEINSFHLPVGKRYVLDALQHDLTMCEQNAASGKYRRAILLEGHSGLGKSTLCKVLLEAKGYAKDAADTSKRYYEISVDESKEIAETLIRAYLGGSKVVLDELNLSKSLEDLLNDLFEGVMPSDAVYRRMMIDIAGTESPTPLPGFQVFASQNSGAEAGRRPLSPAVRNRTHMIHFDKYSEQELIDILNANNIPEAEMMVKQFLSEMHHEPDVINTRNLFAWISSPDRASSIRVFK